MADPNASPPVAGRPAVENPAIVGGPTFNFDHDNDPQTAATVTPIFEIQTGGTLTDGFDIGLTTNAGKATLTQDSYSFRVRIVIDGDTTADGRDDDQPPVVLPTGHNPNNNDQDYTLTANVMVNVLKAKTDDLQFDVVKEKAVKGAVVSGLRNPISSSPLQWEITGISSSAKLIEIADTTGQLGNFEIKEVPAGSGKFRLIVSESGVASLTETEDDSQPNDNLDAFTVALTFDADTAVDSDEEADTDKDENEDVVVTLNGEIGSRNALGFSGTLGEGVGTPPGGTGDANSDGIHYAFTIPQNVSADTPIGYFVVTGGVEGNDAFDDDSVDTTPTITLAAEYLDGIISGPNRGLFEVNDSDMTLKYSGNGELEVGTYDIDLTVSGDAGMANRTIIGKAQVTVTASNQAATAPGTFTETVRENVAGVDEVDDPETTAIDPKPGLVSAGTVVGDASVGVTNPDNDPLTYSITTTSVFKIDSSTGMVTVGEAGIYDTTGGPTETDDEAEYARPGNDGGELEDATNKYSDIVYEFDIRVSDGVSANDNIIKATVTVDVNETVSVDDATAEEDDDGNKYFAASYTDTDPFGTTIFDVGTVLSDDQMASDLEYDMEVTGPEDVAPATFTISSSGVVQLNFPGIVRGADFWMIDITIDDGFDNTPFIKDEDDIDTEDREPDAVVTVKISVTEGIRPDRVHHEVTIPEDTAAGTEIVDLTTIPDAIEGAEDFESVGGDGESKFAVSADGKITVKMDADLDVDAAGADDSYLLSVSVTGANQIDLGEISVVIDIVGVNEAPVFDATDDYARGIPENAQTESNVGAVVQATDPESGDDIAFSVKETDMPFTVVTSENTDGSFSGQIQVDGAIAIADSPYTITVVATDNGSPVGSTDQVVIITIGDINDAPEFDNDAGATSPTLHVTIAENSVPGTAVATYNATDADGGDIIQGVNFVLRNADDTQNFSIVNMTTSGEISGILTVSDTADLEYDIEQDSPAPVTYTVEVNVCDADVDCNEIALIVTLENSDDEPPVIGNTDDSQDVPENSARGTSLGDYGATDKDNLNDPGFDVTKYSLRTCLRSLEYNRLRLLSGG